jgi:hypothetical protein
MNSSLREDRVFEQLWLWSDYLTGEIEQTSVTLAPCVEPCKADVVQHVIVK